MAYNKIPLYDEYIDAGVPTIGQLNLDSSIENACQNTNHNASVLLDTDLVQSLNMWIENPDFLGETLMRQADRLGYSEQEKHDIFKNISKNDIKNMIALNLDGQGSSPNDPNNSAKFCGTKVSNEIEDNNEYLYALFHTPEIIEIYPHRIGETVDIYHTMSHEINHLLMVALMVYRRSKKGQTLSETKQEFHTQRFQEVAETFGWLDGGQAPMDLGYNNWGEIAKFTGHSEQYNENHWYSLATKRSFKIHKMQLNIYNVTGDSNEYQKWSRAIRNALWEALNNPQGLENIDLYLEKYEDKPQEALDTLLQVA
ncbi:hypothetical protein KGV52_00265 [Candidatus Gracilibacteria bacterium]|nr:hypothetical protein [Candidatus Gracilibacteria bacterium]